MNKNDRSSIWGWLILVAGTAVLIFITFLSFFGQRLASQPGTLWANVHRAQSLLESLPSIWRVIALFLTALFSL